MGTKDERDNVTPLLQRPETASASKLMSSSQTFLILLKSCRAFSGPIKNEKASKALLYSMRLVLGLSNRPSSNAL